MRFVFTLCGSRGNLQTGLSLMGSTKKKTRVLKRNHKIKKNRAKWGPALAELGEGVPLQYSVVCDPEGGSLRWRLSCGQRSQKLEFRTLLS